LFSSEEQSLEHTFPMPVTNWVSVIETRRLMGVSVRLASALRRPVRTTTQFPLRDESSLMLTEMFLYLFITTLLIKGELSLGVGSARRGGSDLGCESLAMSSKSPVTHLTLKSGRLLRTKSLHSIMIEHKMSEMQQLWDFSLGVALKSRQNLITAVK